MIEYLHTAIRATAGEDMVVAAKIRDDSGEIYTGGAHLMLYKDNEVLAVVDGVLVDDVYEFHILAETTKNLLGRYWYCICDSGGCSVCFKQPIYLR